jgi:hypothetical protein
MGSVSQVESGRGAGKGTLRFGPRGEGPGLPRRTNVKFGRAPAPHRSRTVSITRYSGQHEIGSRASDPADGRAGCFQRTHSFERHQALRSRAAGFQRYAASGQRYRRIAVVVRVGVP